MATLKLEQLNLVYGGNGNPSTHAVRDVDLVVGYMATTGPSDKWVEVWENKRK